jgi:hypothetical protein
MQPFNSQAASLSSCVDNPTALLGPTLKSVWQRAEDLRHRVAGILKRQLWAENDIVARYHGCGWNDSTERQMFDDIATPGRKRAI